MRLVKVCLIIYFVMIMVSLQGCSIAQENEKTDKQIIKQIIEQTKHYNYYDNLFQKGDIDIEYKRIDKHYDYDTGVLEAELINTIKFTFEGTKFLIIKNQLQSYRADSPISKGYVIKGLTYETTEFFDGKYYYYMHSGGLKRSIECTIKGSVDAIFAEENPLDEYVRCMSTYVNVNETDIKKVSKIVNSDGSYLYKIEVLFKDCIPIVYIVDPQKQFLPKEILFYAEGYIYEKLVVNSYRQDNQGNWFPSAMVHEIYDEKHLNQSTTFEFYKVKFNSDVSLTLTLPVGVKVEDKRVQPSLKYEILRPVQYSELQDPVLAEKEGKIRTIKPSEDEPNNIKAINKKITEYTEMIKLDPSNVDAYIDRALTYMRKGDSKMTKSDLEMALKLDPNNSVAKPLLDSLAESLVKFGLDCYKEGELDNAIIYYTQATEAYPDNAEAWYGLACVYSLKGDKKNSLENLSKAISLDVKYKEKSKKDDDFKAFWNDDDFRKIVENSGDAIPNSKK